MGSPANSSSLQATIKMNPLPLPLSAFSQLSLLTLKPSPRLRLMPTMVIMDMAWPTMGTVMVWLITVTTVLMPTLMLTDTTTARGPLMLSPLLTRTTDITTDMLHTVMLTGVTTATLTLTVPTDTTDIITK